MSMTKYGTFEIWEHLGTKEIKYIPLTEIDEFEKTAEYDKWVRRMDLEKAEGVHKGYPLTPPDKKQ